MIKIFNTPEKVRLFWAGQAYNGSKERGEEGA